MTDEIMTEEDILSDAETLEAITAVLQQRSATYTLLARLFRAEIDEPLLEELHGMLYPVDTGNASTEQGYLLIATFLSNLWEGSVPELKVDYSRCFLGHGVDSFSAAYPYESVYTSPKRLMMEKARSQVLKAYRKYGLGKSDKWKEGEDHIALELEFEQFLGDKCAEALAKGDRKEAVKILQDAFDFIKNHLINWTPMLTGDMKTFAQTKMYQGLAYLTDGFLQTDEQFLEELLDDLR